MKETQIAKINVKNIKKYGYRESADTHKASCQRFLEFLEDTNEKIINKLILIGELIGKNDSEQLQRDFDEMIESDKQHIGINEKIADLKNAIKIYSKKEI